MSEPVPDVVHVATLSTGFDMGAVSHRPRNKRVESATGLVATPGFAANEYGR